MGGETAENINTPGWLQQITTALEQNPDADFVHLSFGGNDFLGNWSAFISQAQEDELIASILEDITAIVDHILQQRPAIRIYWSSYDFPRPLFIGAPIAVNNASMRFSAKAQALADARGSALSYGDFNGLTQTEYGFDGIQASPYDPGIPGHQAGIPCLVHLRHGTPGRRRYRIPGRARPSMADCARALRRGYRQSHYMFPSSGLLRTTWRCVRR